MFIFIIYLFKGFDDSYPLIIHALVTFMAHINSTMNPLFYMCLNPAFLTSFRKLRGKLSGKTGHLHVTKTGDENHSTHNHTYTNKTAMGETTLN